MHLPLRLMTVNLLHDGATPEAFAKLIDHANPDVVVTQELNPDCAVVLSERYPHTLLNPTRDFTGRGIASRHPGEMKWVDIPLRPASQLSLDGLTILGVHVVNPIGAPIWDKPGLRRRQLHSVEAWVDSTTGPLVVAGDFNSSPAWPLYRSLNSGPLRDLVASHHEEHGTRSARTWAWRPGWRRLLRIDHVFGRGMTCTNVDVVELEGSDHWAVITDLHIRS